jgi:hypothetical protein
MPAQLSALISLIAGTVGGSFQASRHIGAAHAQQCRWLRRGECAEEALYEKSTRTWYNTGRLRVVPQTGEILCPNGTAHSRRFAFGAFTNGGSAGGFTRPRRNGLFFRQNDAAARRFLGILRSIHGGRSVVG